MYRIFVFLTILFIFLSLISKAEINKRVLILYDSVSRLGENYPIENLLEEYLSHFDVIVGSCESDNISNIEYYDLVIYLGLQEKILDKKFLKEISKSKKLIWIEENIEQYAKYIGFPYFREERKEYNFTRVLYKNYNLSINPDIPVHTVRLKEGDIISYVSDDFNRYPWAFKKENLYYFGRLDFRDPTGIVFLDSLHDIISVNHPSYKKAILLLDNINPLTLPDSLLEKYQTICCHEIPHLIVVYPSIKKDNKTYFLTENPKLLELLQDIEKTQNNIAQGSYLEKNFSEKIKNDLHLLASYNIFPLAFKFYDVPYKEKLVDVGKYFKILLSGVLSAS